MQVFQYSHFMSLILLLINDTNKNIIAEKNNYKDFQFWLTGAENDSKRFDHRQ